MNLQASPLFTVIYRGTLKDTAALVGLTNARANVGCIAFIGDASSELRSYCDKVSNWLTARRLPSISFHDSVRDFDSTNVLNCPTRDWGWEEKECIAAIHFAGLPLPPNNA